MKVKSRLGVILAAIVILAAVFVPRLARRLDSALESRQTRAMEEAALYCEMTNAYPIASEMPSDHPMARRWRECRAKLMESGYLETRELPLQDRLAAKGATTAFFKAFQARFPGLECGLRAPKTDQAVAIITAPKADFGLLGSIEHFVRGYRHGSGWLGVGRAGAPLN